MFLSKKNAAYLTKPQKGKSIQPRVLPGWGDDDNQSNEKYDYGFTHQLVTNKQQNTPFESLLDPAESVDRPPHNQPAVKIYYDWDELNQMNNIECEKKLVEDIVQVGGVRIKPNDNMLSEFMKQCKGMQPKYIGSLLLSKLEVNYSFPIKAKALYTIEYLSKKNGSYANYFKVQSQRIREFPEPEQNVQNYRKILKSTLNTIGISMQGLTEKQQGSISYIDPGYNDSKTTEIKQFLQSNERPKNKEKTSKKFISPSQMKKNTNTNTNGNFDLLEEGTSKNQNGSNDFGLNGLVFPNEASTSHSNNNGLKFDDLMSGQTKKQEPTFDLV